MKTKLLLILSLFLLSAQLYGASARQEVQKLKRELELDLQEHLANSLKQHYGLDQVMVSAQVKLDEQGLMRSWGVEQDAMNLSGSLPGFASSGYEAQLLKSASVTEARGFIEKLDLKLHTFSENYDRTQLEKFVVLLAANHSKLSEQKITVQSDVSNFQLVKPKVSPRVKELETVEGFLRRHWQLLSFGLLGTIALATLTLTLRNGFKNLGRNLASTSSAVSGSGIGDRRTVATGSVTLNDSVSEKSMLNLLAIRGELEQLGKKHPFELEGLLQIKAELGEIRESIMLLECVDPGQRELVLQRLMKHQGIDAENFLTKYSQDLLQNFQQTPAQTANLLRLFKLILLSPSSMRKMTLLESLNHLTSTDLVQLYRVCSEAEKRFLLGHLPEGAVGYLVSHVKTTPATEAQSIEYNEDQVIVDLTRSIGSFRRSMTQKHDTERTLRIYAQMPFSEAEAYAEHAGIPKELRLPSLHEKYKTASQNFVKTLSFDKMSGLVSMLEPEIKAEILIGLPEILSERLKFVRQTAFSTELRGEFYFYLYQIHQTTTVDADAPVELKAA